MMVLDSDLKKMVMLEYYSTDAAFNEAIKRMATSKDPEYAAIMLS